MTELGSYVYGVAREGDPATATGLSGVADSPVRALAYGTLTALVSTVDLKEFGTPNLQRNLEDLGWLETIARAHHAVLAAAMLNGPVVPLRLATIFRDDDGVRTMLAERGATFDTALRLVRGRTEWGLKAYLNPAAPPVERGDPGSDSDRPGTAYLQRRRAQVLDGEKLRHSAVQGAERIHRAVSAAAEAARRYPPQHAGLSGESQEMMLNAAYLLSGTDRAPLDHALSQAGTWPLRVEWTGPWVPYSFVELDPGELEPGELEPGS